MSQGKFWKCFYDGDDNDGDNNDDGNDGDDNDDEDGEKVIKGSALLQHTIRGANKDNFVKREFSNNKKQ